jgi:hypothetical protein
LRRGEAVQMVGEIFVSLSNPCIGGCGFFVWDFVGVKKERKKETAGVVFRIL